MTTVTKDEFDLANALRMLWWKADPTGPTIDALLDVIKDSGWAKKWPVVDPDDPVSHVIAESPEQVQVHARFELPEMRQAAFDPEVHALRMVQRGLAREHAKLPEPNVIVDQQIRTVIARYEDGQPIIGPGGVVRRYVEGRCLVRLLGGGPTS